MECHKSLITASLLLPHLLRPLRFLPHPAAVLIVGLRQLLARHPIIFQPWPFLLTYPVPLRRPRQCWLQFEFPCWFPCRLNRKAQGFFCRCRTAEGLDTLLPKSLPLYASPTRKSIPVWTPHCGILFLGLGCWNGVARCHRQSHLEVLIQMFSRLYFLDSQRLLPFFFKNSNLFLLLFHF